VTIDRDARDARKHDLYAEIDRRADALCRFGEDIFDHPELGFREERTATRVAEELRALGLTVDEGLARTGVRATLHGAAPGPTIAIMGELDALPVPGHPRADPATGAAHACGHNAQLAHLLGVASALVATDAARDVAGTIVFLAVPAEEYVDLAWRAAAARRGEIEFLGGKPELVRRGVFDGIDLALMVHASGNDGDAPLSILWDFGGFVAKRIRFLGRAAHAGVAPHRGINALAAARIGLQAIDAVRDTFRDDDRIRVHPIVTHGGDAVNVVPHEVRVETFVRGASLAAIADAAAKVDRAMRAGAYAIGAAVEIETLPGYLPLAVDRSMGALFRENAVALVGAGGYDEGPICGACTDAGDLSTLMPVLHPNHGGCAGFNHTIDFRIVDPQAAYVTPAKALAGTVVDLLGDDARAARATLAAFVPHFTRDAYLAHIRASTRTEHFTGADLK
jgi:amidohydrolase